MAHRSRSSSISVAERVIARACALYAVTVCGCQNKKPEGAQPTPSASTAVASATLQPQPSAAPPPPRIHRIGQLATANDYTLTLTEVKRCSGTRIAPRAGNVRMGVKLEIAGTSSREVPVNPFYARLVDRERDGYGYAATFGGCEPDLKSAHVTEGQSMSGWVTFEIPEKATGLELTYSPYILNSAEQPVKFDLGR